MKKNVSKVFSIIFLIFILAVISAFPFVCYAQVYTDTSYGVSPDGWLGTGFTMILPSRVESTAGKLVTNFGSVPYFLGRPLDYSYFYSYNDILDYGSNSTGRGFGTRYIDFKSFSSSDNWYNEYTNFSDVYVFYGSNVHVSRGTPYSTWEDVYNRIGTTYVSPDIIGSVTNVGGPVPSFVYNGAIDANLFTLESEYQSIFDSLPKSLTYYQIMNATYDYNSVVAGNSLGYEINISGMSVGVDVLDNGSTIRQYGFENSLSTLSATSAVTVSDVSITDDKFAYALDKYYVDNNSDLRVRKVVFDLEPLVYDNMISVASNSLVFDKLLYIRDFKFDIIPYYTSGDTIHSAYNSIDIRQFIDYYSSVPIVSLSLDYEGAFGDSNQHNMGDIGNNVIVVDGGGEGGGSGDVPATDFTGWLSDTLSTFFDTKLFGFFGLGDILFTCLAIVIVFLLLKFFAGG